MELQSTSWLSGLNLRGAERYSRAEAPSSQMRFPQDRALPLVMRLPEDRAGAPSDQGPVSGLRLARTGLLALHHPAGPGPHWITNVSLPCPLPQSILPLPFLTPRIRSRDPSPRMPQCQHLPMGNLPPRQSKQRRGQRAETGTLDPLPRLRPSSALYRGPRWPVLARELAAELQASEGVCESCPLGFLAGKESVHKTGAGGWRAPAVTSGPAALVLSPECLLPPELPPNQTINSMRAGTGRPIPTAPPRPSSVWSKPQAVAF